MNTSTIATLKTYFLGLQENLCQALEAEDGREQFTRDNWERSVSQGMDLGSGGGGCSRVLKNGAVIEQAGVNFSHVLGENLPVAATEKRPELVDSTFEALGVSVVIHPLNPYVPTSHMNVRFIMTRKANEASSWWFGGGFDLTPYYPFDEDCIHWHRIARQACAPFGQDVYPKYKKWCDEYFFLKHRNEQRGIGGLFFDDLNHWSFEKCFEFIRSVGDHFILGYLPIVAHRKSLPFDGQERAFQLYRRGRYVEFNLLYDRGTLFGLQSNGRVESILMSLPPEVRFEYDWQAAPGSKEELLISKYLKPRDWLD